MKDRHQISCELASLSASSASITASDSLKRHVHASSAGILLTTASATIDGQGSRRYRSAISSNRKQPAAFEFLPQISQLLLASAMPGDPQNSNKLASASRSIPEQQTDTILNSLGLATGSHASAAIHPSQHSFAGIQIPHVGHHPDTHQLPNFVTFSGDTNINKDQVWAAIFDLQHRVSYLETILFDGGMPAADAMRSGLGSQDNEPAALAPPATPPAAPQGEGRPKAIASKAAIDAGKEAEATMVLLLVCNRPNFNGCSVESLSVSASPSSKSPPIPTSPS